MTRSQRRGVVGVVMLLSVGAVAAILYRYGVRDEYTYASVALLVVFYEWIFLWR